MPTEGHERLPSYHDRVRRRGVQPVVYWLTRALLQPAIQVWFRLRRTGREHIPAGGVILASNHRSFLDPFVIGCCLRRPIYFVAKSELFHNRLVAWFLNCLGAFPIRRGDSDEESVQTALALLERGEAVVIFPEGTRHRSGPLHDPKRGVGRLALESGAPIVPIAIRGTERAAPGPVDPAGARGHPLRAPAHVPARARRLAAPGARSDGTYLALRRAAVGMAGRSDAPRRARHRIRPPAPGGLTGRE